MRQYETLFLISETSFHILRLGDTQFDAFIAELKKNSPPRNHLAVIEGSAIFNIDDLFSAFSRAYEFPSYFGRNWDALDECLNDLKWLKADSYVLVMRELVRARLSRENQLILLEILKKAAREWMHGRTFNPSFPTRPTPFHVVFVVDEQNEARIADLLNTAGIQDIDTL
ncbi:MAG: barstar family protein [Chloroflexi bacterium]|nr:barstar family protein [Chloroflexota bacterium]